MTIFKSALAGAAASALLVSQAAAAAPSVSPARAGAPVGQAEELGGLPSAAMPAIAAISIFILVGLVLLVTEDDDEETPTSP